jgi:gluconokinase
VSQQQIVVMGVSGSGKSTTGERLARALGWSFAEGDDFHPEENVRKMAEGRALTDEDRWPWLLAIRAWMTREDLAGRDSVVSCSALRRAYRDVLRQGPSRVTFAYLEVSEEALRARLAGRTGHFMPESLLDSQLNTLEVPGEDEGAVVVNGNQTPAEIVADILSALHQQEA